MFRAARSLAFIVESVVVGFSLAIGWFMALVVLSAVVA